jgi:hypothetical protein
MAQDDRFDARREILRVLMQKVARDRHPSGAMLNQIERLLRTPDDVEMYVRTLMDKIETERNPSIDMLNRVLAQAT